MACEQPIVKVPFLHANGFSWDERVYHRKTQTPLEWNLLIKLYIQILGEVPKN